MNERLKERKKHLANFHQSKRLYELDEKKMRVRPLNPEQTAGEGCLCESVYVRVKMSNV